MSNPKQLTLGQKIRMARREKGLSQREVADHLKLSDKAISSYEVDRSEPTLGNLKEIGKLTDKPIMYFVDDDANFEEMALKSKIMTIERELRAIKDILTKKK